MQHAGWRYASLLGLSLIVIPVDGMGIPAFSRQINADCRTCHFQSYPALNAFGRQFKLNAFRETKEMRKERLEKEKRKRKSPPEE